MDIDHRPDPRAEQRGAADLALDEQRFGGRDVPDRLVLRAGQAFVAQCGHDAAVAEAIHIATEDAVTSGADPSLVEVIEVEDLPIAYLPGDARRVRARVVGPLK